MDKATTIASCQERLDNLIKISGWDDVPRRLLLGSGPCPGEEGDPQGIQGGDEDEGPSYPFPEWEGVHDFGGGQCWRCGGFQPGHNLQRPPIVIEAIRLRNLLDMLTLE